MEKDSSQRAPGNQDGIPPAGLPSAADEPVPRNDEDHALGRRSGGWPRKLSSSEELRARQNQQLIDELRHGTLQWINSENWGLPPETVVLVPRRIAEENRDLLLSYLGVRAGPDAVKTKGLWQAVLRPMDSRALERLPRTLRREFGAPLLLPDVTRFYLKLKELTRPPNGLRKSPEWISTVRRRLRWAHSDGERLLWQSLLEDLERPSNEAASVAAQCRFCEEVFIPPERSNARTDVCRKPGCRRRAEAERKRQEYRARVDPAEETKRLADVGARAIGVSLKGLLEGPPAATDKEATELLKSLAEVGRAVEGSTALRARYLSQASSRSYRAKLRAHRSGR